MALLGECRRRTFDTHALVAGFHGALIQHRKLGGSAALALAPAVALLGDLCEPALGQLGSAGKCLRFRAHLGEVAAVALDLATHLRKLGLDALRGRKLSERVLGLASSRRGLLAIGFDPRLRLCQG